MWKIIIINVIMLKKVHVPKFTQCHEQLVLILLSQNCSQEVGCCYSLRDDSFWVGHCFKQFGLSFFSVWKFQNGGYVATTIAIVGCWPHSHQLIFKHILDALMNQLMCSTDQLQIIEVHKLQQENWNSTITIPVQPTEILNISKAVSAKQGQ